MTICKEACSESLMFKNGAAYIVKSLSITNKAKSFLHWYRKWSLQLFVTPHCWLWNTCTASRLNSRRRSITRGTGCRSLCQYQRQTGLRLCSLVRHFCCCVFVGPVSQPERESSAVQTLYQLSASKWQSGKKSCQIKRLSQENTYIRSVSGKSTPKERGFSYWYKPWENAVYFTGPNLTSHQSLHW